MRAQLQIAELYISSGRADKVLLVSAISGVDTYNAGCITSVEDLTFKFAGLTVSVVRSCTPYPCAFM